MEDLLLKNKTLISGYGDPLQAKITKVFNGTYKHQTGGNMSMDDNNAAVASYLRQSFQVDFPLDAWMRMWKVIFEYKSESNFEFNGFGIVFVAKESPL
jgi:hypothetical protein